MSSVDPAAAIAALNQKFAVRGIAAIVAGNNALPKLQIATAAGAAEIYFHGAHLTSWRPAGQEEVLFLSERSQWQPGKAIRGGIPICFPWFRGKADDPKAPSHGFARTSEWALDSIAHVIADDPGSAVVVTLSLTPSEATRQLWPHEFRLTHRITVGEQLKLEFTVTNTGDTSFEFEEALHTYFRIGDVASIQIDGLEGTSYLDNRDGNREKQQDGAIHLCGATDNAYLSEASPIEIVDPAWQRRLRTAKQNSATTIVWTPWQEGAAALSDLGDEEWRQFACVEAGNILAGAVTLAPGERHTIEAKLSIPR